MSVHHWNPLSVVIGGIVLVVAMAGFVFAKLFSISQVQFVPRSVPIIIFRLILPFHNFLLPFCPSGEKLTQGGKSFYTRFFVFLYIWRFSQITGITYWIHVPFKYNVTHCQASPAVFCTSSPSFSFGKYRLQIKFYTHSIFHFVLK